jgi:long-chain acyl-CoA synthetase
MGNSTERQSVQYSSEFRGATSEGQTGVFRNQSFPYSLASVPRNSAETVYQNLMLSVRAFGDRQCLGTKVEDEYHWKTYRQVFDLAQRLMSGLVTQRLVQENDQGLMTLGILSLNREEWIIGDLACVLGNFTVVPLYSSYGAEAVAEIVDLTGIHSVLCSGDKLSLIVKMRKETGGISQLRTIILMDDVELSLAQEAESLGFTLVSYKALIEVTEVVQPQPPTPESIFTICFTSGATGTCKGAVVTHANIMASIAGVEAMGFAFQPGDVHISYLPLAHMMERVFAHLMLTEGASIGFYSGSVRQLKDDMEVLKPTIFVSVPRIFNMFYTTIRQRFDSLPYARRQVVSQAVSSKLSSYNETGALTSTVWDSMVFNKIKATVGGRVRLMVSGSAPISGEVLRFLRICFCCPILEGYGQTESCAASFLTRFDDVECGRIGGPVPSIEFKLIDVPSMNYFTSGSDELGTFHPRGELLLRGTPVVKSYYKLPEATENLIDSEGWLHTGDVVMLLPGGAVKVIDRVKHIFKLSQGEYIAPERLECIYNESQFVETLMVYGDSYKDFLAAVVYPNEEFLKQEWCREKEIPKETPMEVLCANEDLINDILLDLSTIARKENLVGYEFIKKIWLSPKPFPIELFTPTQKLKRHETKRHFQEAIIQLFNS